MRTMRTGRVILRTIHDITHPDNIRDTIMQIFGKADTFNRKLLAVAIPFLIMDYIRINSIVYDMHYRDDWNKYSELCQYAVGYLGDQVSECSLFPIV